MAMDDHDVVIVGDEPVGAEPDRGLRSGGKIHLRRTATPGQDKCARCRIGRIRRRCRPMPAIDTEADQRGGCCVLADAAIGQVRIRSEEQTSELPSLMRISYAGLRLKKKNKTKPQ